MDYRNATFTKVGLIDCEINHPDHGWIPFTASPDDVEKHGRDIYQVVLSEGHVAAYVEPQVDLAAARQEMSCSKMQGILTLGETKWGEVLAYRETATWSEKMIIDSAQDWRRTSQNIQFIGYLVGYTDTEMDALFIVAQSVDA